MMTNGSLAISTSKQLLREECGACLNGGYDLHDRARFQSRSLPSLRSHLHTFYQHYNKAGM